MNVHLGRDSERDWLTVEKDPAQEWSDDDLRALNTALGSQVMIVHLPPVPTVPWVSSDEHAAFTVTDAGALVIGTSRPSISPFTAMELAAAITAYLYHRQQEHTSGVVS